MALKPIDLLRIQAASSAADAFADALGGPVLLWRHRLEGDLHFTDPNSRGPSVRPGATLLHVPRVSAKARLTAPPRPGRSAVDEQVLVLSGTGPLTVGRGSENMLVLRDHSVSTRHAELYPVPNTNWVFLVDAGSRNGTAHNDQQLLQGERAELQSGDEVCFGREVFVFLHGHDLYRYLTGSL